MRPSNSRVRGFRIHRAALTRCVIASHSLRTTGDPSQDSRYRNVSFALRARHGCGLQRSNFRPSFFRKLAAFPDGCSDRRRRFLCARGVRHRMFAKLMRGRPVDARRTGPCSRRRLTRRCTAILWLGASLVVLGDFLANGYWFQFPTGRCCPRLASGAYICTTTGNDTGARGNRLSNPETRHRGGRQRQSHAPLTMR